jgi:Flp pilus assembly protein TadD
MEGNKDDAARCAEIGETAFKNGDYNKAMKFLGKAQKLYPSNSVSASLQMSFCCITSCSICE